MILYSLIIFIGLGFLLSSHKNYTENAIIIAVILISSSEIIYFVNISSLLPIYAIIIIIATIVIPYLVPKALTPYSYLALVMPLLLYIIKFNQFGFLAINVAVIGYYLLISAVISMLITLIVKAGKMRTSKKVRMLSIHESNVITPFVLIAGLVLLIAPIWPAGPHLILSGLPYINITLFNTNNISTPSTLIYNLAINHTVYSDFEYYGANNNLSNVRFFYQNGTGIPFSKYANQTSVYIALSLNKIAPYTTEHIRLVFLPNDARLDSSIASAYQPYNQSSDIKTYTDLKATFGQIRGVFSNMSINKTITAYKDEEKNATYGFYTSLSPYYSTESYCTPSVAMSATIEITANKTISAFVLGGLSNLSQATSLIWGITQTYPYYLSKFLSNSNISELNKTAIELRVPMSNESCIYYALVTPGPAQANVSVSASYYQKIPITHIIKVPYILAHPIISNYSFLNDGLTYLIQFYDNETNSGT
jgi:hypothetical protein